MPLCVVGQILFEKYQKVADSFSDDLSRANTYEQREKVISLFSQAFDAYEGHVVHCLECNIDQREMM